ncbi:MAG: hypothetical protein Fur0046_20870 [Cyanobacteria bacterium J069]
MGEAGEGVADGVGEGVGVIDGVGEGVIDGGGEGIDTTGFFAVVLPEPESQPIIITTNQTISDQISIICGVLSSQFKNRKKPTKHVEAGGKKSLSVLH